MSCKTYKYNVRPKQNEPFMVTAPVGARFTTIKFDRFTGELFLYAVVDPELPEISHPVYIVGTGWDIPVPNAELLRYLGTATTDGGLVWHAYVWGV